MFHRESAAEQEIRGLALGRAVAGECIRMPPTQQVAGGFAPVAIETVHRSSHDSVAEAMGTEFGADPAGAITGGSAAAYQRFGEAGVVLPARLGQFVDRCL